MLRRLATLSPGPWLAGLVCLVLLPGAPGSARGAEPDGAHLGAFGVSFPLPLPSGTPELDSAERVVAGGGRRPPGDLPSPASSRSDGPCRDVFCPWRARDALARAGFPSTLPTAPPRFLV